MRIDITLRGEDAEWFCELRDEEADNRRGSEPTRAEMLRLLMREYDDDGSGRHR